MKNRLLTLIRFVAKHQLLLVPIFLGVLIPLLAFAKSAEEVWTEGGFERDVPFLQFVHHYANPTLDALMVFITRLGGTAYMIPLTAIILFVLIRSKYRSGAWFFALAVGGACVLNILVKAGFHRARPTLWISPAPEYDYGFPSGHSMLTMAVVTALVLLTWRTRWRWPVFVCGGLFVLAVGLSRAYLGVHFPSDVLAGWSASLAWVSSVYLVLSSTGKLHWPKQNTVITEYGTDEKEKENNKRLLYQAAL